MKSSLTFEPDISQRISVLCVLFFNKTTKKSSGSLDSSRTQTMPIAISFQKHKFVCSKPIAKVSPTQRRVFTVYSLLYQRYNRERYRRTYGTLATYIATVSKQTQDFFKVKRYCKHS